MVPWRELGEAVTARVLRGAALPAALNDVASSLAAQAISFVEHSALSPGLAYEQFVSDCGQCPTRENLHDFFNGLCWLRFPKIKRRFNTLQVQAMQAATASGKAVRGPVRDALTLFDENGALLQAPPALWAALQERDWRALLVDGRDSWREARLTLFGHALLEKLVAPRKAITAHIYLFDLCLSAAPQWAELDAGVAADLSAEKLSQKPFLPLPVLGVPGWCVANAAPAFYADPAVFRPGTRTGAQAHSL